MTCRILLICSAAPESPLFPGDHPPPQAALAGIGRLPGQAALTSPLLRARRTAEAMGLDAAPDPALAELDYGAWTGRRPDEILASDPADFALWLRDPRAAPHGGESFAAMSRRIGDWLARQALRGGKLVAVTHPGPMRAALIHVLDAPPDAAPRIGVRPLSRLSLAHDGRRWSLALEPWREGTAP